MVQTPAFGPSLDVMLMVAPGASPALVVYQKACSVPSTKNPMPIVAPAGVAVSPWFLIVALNRTASPTAGVAGVVENAVTTRSTPVALVVFVPPPVPFVEL